MDLSSNYISRNGFRRIEYWIEEDRGAQIRLSKQEWNAEKIRKKDLNGLFSVFCDCKCVFSLFSRE
jgi:hypothetical protein